MIGWLARLEATNIIMNLIINFTEKRGEAELQLRDEKKLIDSLTFEFEANLDTVLIEAVDKILKKNTIDTSSLKTVKVVGEVNKDSSAYKVAQTFVEALKSR